VAEAGSVAEAVAKARESVPDVVVMDIRLPDGTGIEACREIRDENSDVKVLMLTSYSDEEAVMGSMIAVLIMFINSKPVKSHVECICSTRNIRKRNIALVKDLVKVKIIGKLNGAIHATINGPELGVLFTKCRKCGKNVKPLRDIIKCTECGWTDDRKLSSDFLKSDFVKVGE
jgi:CheY-like chemotaxis protein